MLFSEKLKMLRKGSNLTQEELADKLDVSRQAITKWESNEGLPDIENLKQISLLFNVSIDELIKDEKIVKKEFNYFKEIEIDHTKHFDINISSIYELNILSSNKEVVRVEITGSEDDYSIIFDDKYDNLDIDIKGKNNLENTINLYIPEKYINDIELKSKIKYLNIENLSLNELEYDGDLKYLNIRKTSGSIILNTTRSDVEVDYDKLDGSLDVNIVNSVARVSIPSNTSYNILLKGIKNEIVNAKPREDSNNIIELNGLNSKLIIIEK